MRKKTLSMRYWEKRCERLFKIADDMGDTLSADIRIFRKQDRLYREAVLIRMMLDSFETVVDKLTDEVMELRQMLGETCQGS